MRVHMPTQSGDERLVPAPCWSAPLESVIAIPFPVATSPEIAATSGVPRNCVGATPAWYGGAGICVLFPPPVNSHAVSDRRFGGLPPSLFKTVPPTATAYGLADG